MKEQLFFFLVALTNSGSIPVDIRPSHPVKDHNGQPSVPCSECPNSQLKKKIQKAKHILRLLQETQDLNVLPKAEQLVGATHKSYTLDDSVDATTPKTFKHPEKSPEKWFVPINPKQYKSPDSPETWFGPIVSRTFKTSDKSSKSVQHKMPPLINNKSPGDKKQNDQVDSNHSTLPWSESPAEATEETKTKLLEPITLLALKIFNSLPKPLPKEEEAHTTEEKKNIGIDLREDEVNDVVDVGNKEVDSASKMAVPISEQDWSPDKEDHTKKNNKTNSEAEEGNFDFGAKLDDESENIKKSSTEGSTAGDKKKIRFRPRKSHLTQLLMHTKVKFFKEYQDFFFMLQELGLVQKLGDVFSMFPVKEEEQEGSQYGVRCILSDFYASAFLFWIDIINLC